MPYKDLSSARSLVARERDLADLCEVLSARPAVAVDTESNSLYAYRERTCLIQLSIQGADYIVDPLAGLDLASLGALFADPAVQKVFHAAEQDIAGMKRDFRFEFANLFDTMWAGRILGWPKLGLADLLEEHFGVRLAKRYQRYNWGGRPLAPEALAYARMDTCYLLPLRDRQMEALERAGRLEEAGEIFADLTRTPPAVVPYGAGAFWRVKDIHTVRGRARAILWELYRWRDSVAKRRDRPPFKVLGDRTMVAVALAAPRTLEGLGGIKGITPYLLRRYGRALLAAVRRGEGGAVPRPPRRRRLPQPVLGRYRALRAWRQEAAGRRGVDADVILSRDALWMLARQAPATVEDLEGIPCLGPWRRRTYGPEILRVLHPTSQD